MKQKILSSNLAVVKFENGVIEFYDTEFMRDTPFDYDKHHCACNCMRLSGTESEELVKFIKET